jgi:hypothetical protein
MGEGLVRSPQLGVLHWLEKFRSYTHHALEYAELTLARSAWMGEPRDWNLAAGNDDLLTALNSGEKLGKIWSSRRAW